MFRRGVTSTDIGTMLKEEYNYQVENLIYNIQYKKKHVKQKKSAGTTLSSIRRKILLFSVEKDDIDFHLWLINREY